MSSRFGTKPHRVGCQKVHTPTEAWWKDIVRSLLAYLSGKILTRSRLACWLKKYNLFKAISKQRSGDTADDFIEGLRHFDKDASGFISSAELRHLLTTLGEKLSDEEVEQLMNNQEDSQGNVNYEEFVRMVMNG